MGHGGHHGGGFHSGGHHGGGGFHGGGGGFHSSYHGGGGGYHGGGGGDISSDDAGFVAGTLGAVALVYMYIMAAEGSLPGFELGNLTIFVVCAILLAIGMGNNERMSSIQDLRGHPHRVFGVVWKGVQSSGDLSDKCSWAGRYTKRYRIAFYDKDFGEDNCNVVRETMARTPKILWIRPVTWVVISVIAFFSSFYFYEGVIPVFENMRMSDEAFAFIDELVFYFPCIIAGLCAVTCLVFVVIKDNLLYKCAIRCIENNLAAIERKKAEDAIKGIENSKWYYNNCPNCGASAASPVLKSCSFCGTSLEVTDFTNGVPSAVHKIAFVPKKPDIPGSKGDSK